MRSGQALLRRDQSLMGRVSGWLGPSHGRIMSVLAGWTGDACGCRRGVSRGQRVHASFLEHPRKSTPLAVPPRPRRVDNGHGAAGSTDWDDHRLVSLPDADRCRSSASGRGSSRGDDDREPMAAPEDHVRPSDQPATRRGASFPSNCCNKTHLETITNHVILISVFL